MAVSHLTYELDDVTPTEIPVYFGQNSSVVFQHSDHGTEYDVVLGGPAQLRKISEP